MFILYEKGQRGTKDYITYLVAIMAMACCYNSKAIDWYSLWYVWLGPKLNVLKENKIMIPQGAKVHTTMLLLNLKKRRSIRKSSRKNGRSWW